MHILLVKLSSLGDVIHNFPIVTDIRRAYPHAIVDWATDASYASVVAMHPGINRVLPVHLRALKKSWSQPRGYWQLLADRKMLGHEKYDLTIDTQGLLKSGLVAYCAGSDIAGYDKNSIREPIVSRFYQRQYAVSRTEHAVVRNRRLAALALDYQLPAICDYGITAPTVASAITPTNKPYAVLLHATSRSDKTWDVSSWIALGRALNQTGLTVVLPSGNAAEYATSQRIASGLEYAQALDNMPLSATAAMIARAAFVVGVDTGLTHLAVALNRPTVGIYLTTQPALTGLYAGRSNNDANNVITVNLGGGTRQQATIVGVEDVLAVLAGVTMRAGTT